MKNILLTGILVLVLGLTGCAPNLVSYPPAPMNPSVVERLQNLKLGSQMPSEEYGLALNSVIEHTKNTTLVYQQKLFPVFNQMHQKYQKKDYDGTDVLIAKARGYNKEWANSYLALKNAYEKLSEANKNISNATIKIKTEQLVESSKALVEEVLNTINAIRALLDITEGYDKARVEMNLSFLTNENEQKFNRLSQRLHQSSSELSKMFANQLNTLESLNK